jgi:hypothetical protein
LIHPVLLYGSETWVLTKREETNCSYLRERFSEIENGVYRRRYSHELDREFDSPNALNVMKTSRLGYAGHMARRPTTKSSIQSQTHRKEKSR